MADATAQAGDAPSDEVRGRDDERRHLTIGVLVAHDISGTLARELANELPGALHEQFPDIEWHAELAETAAADPATTSHDLLRTVRRHLLERDWGVAVGLTGLPLHSGHRPVTAYASAAQSVGLVCVPALGAVGRRKRLRDIVGHLVEGLLGESVRPGTRDAADGRGARMRRRLHELTSPLGGERLRDDGTLRFAGAVLRGNLRLLVGMVRANDPATVVTRLSRAMIGALGTGVFALVSSNVWSLAGALSWPRLAAISLVSLAMTCIALVVAHDLWEHATSPAARERVMLFNIVTITTLAIGVMSLFAGLFALFALTAGVVIPAAQLSQNIGHAARIGDYLALALFVASIAVVGGALGSLAESDEAVREAAYRAHDDQRVEG
jgi:uncharacterized membrane protein